MSKSIQLKDKNNEKFYPHPYYPVGSIYLSVNNTNPSKWFGGTWVQIAKGRTLVGVDTNDADFNTVKKTGGEKKHKLTNAELPKLNGHFGVNVLDNYQNYLSGVFSAGGLSGVGRGVMNNTNDYALWGIQFNAGNDQPHNNMPPYFTCYIWCRTA